MGLGRFVPTTAQRCDAYALVYTPGGARGFGTYFGGSARDDGWDIEVDGQGSIYVAGLTGSTNFPLVNPIQATYGGAGDDGFVARFFPNGSSVAYSTYLGGNLSDQARAIDLWGNTDAYVTGSTGSTNFPLVSLYQGVLAGYNDIFISRITDSTPPHEQSRNITYTYDRLYRLTAADYDNGTYFHYSYDPVGNRLTETTLAGTTTFVYDAANRLTSVGGVPYSWSNNGNLLSDGTYTYAYDHASRLTSATWGSLTYGFSYNGLGDRLRQTVAGTPTNYSLDIVGGLTQVLSDGTNAYLYPSASLGAGSNTRIGEEQPGGWQYHLGDALGSVRQLVDASVSVTVSRAYEPFGDPLLTTGTGSSIYGFTGEQRDGTGLVYLRARYYGPAFGRFLTRDIQPGNPHLPATFHPFAYVLNNPANATDPSGQWCFHGVDVWPYELDPCTPEEHERAARRQAQIGELLRPVYAAIYELGTNPRLINALPPEFWIAGGRVVEFHNQQYAIVFSNRPLEERIAPCTFVAVESTVISFVTVEGGSSAFHSLGLLLDEPVEIPSEEPGSPPYPLAPPGSRGPYVAPYPYRQDPSESPDPGFRWEPPDRAPGVPEGSWYNRSTDEYLRWDPDVSRHGSPHYDYRDPFGDEYWIWPDGSMSPK